jgi:hypothetical protein
VQAKCSFRTLFRETFRQICPYRVEKWTALGATLGVSVAMAGLLTSGCATPVATLDIIAPSTARAGSPFTITITAMLNGSQDKIFNDEIHVTSSDPAAVLPIFYQFTAADAGSHTFANGVTLMTPGSQTITATATTSAGITGTTTVTVSAANATLQFKKKSSLARIIAGILGARAEGLLFSVFPKPYGAHYGSGLGNQYAFLLLKMRSRVMVMICRSKVRLQLRR